MTRKAYVIGAGLAGLSAAVRLAEAGWSVELSEAAAQAGGRCRSYFDPQLGMTVDNGNHLVLAGNRAVADYLRLIGASDRLAGPGQADFAFYDVRDASRWRVRPNDGPLAWWVLAKDRRPPGTQPADFLALAKLLLRHPGRRIDQIMACKGELWTRLLEPFLLAVLNTQPEEGSADLAGAVVRESLALGGRASRPRVADPTLAAAFIEPALVYLAKAGARVRLSRRLRSIEQDGARATALVFADGAGSLSPDDRVVLAVPPVAAQGLLPGLSVPDEHRAIVNGHFALTPELAARVKGAAPITGVIGGLVQWVFLFEDRVSVTISGADAVVDREREDLAAATWADVAATLDIAGEPLPVWQVVKEKRATFAATPAQDALRPPARTALANLVLAGDWTQTGLPATIEGALRSGETAARLTV